MSYYCLICKCEHDGLPTLCKAPRCADCKHFYKPELKHQYTQLHDRVGVCTNTPMWYGAVEKRLFVEDQGTYIQHIGVGEDFGCVHFEAKP